MTIDLLLVGGGLANSLLAFRLVTERPDLELVVLERGSSLGGSHTWSFHEHDLTVQQRRWLRPLVEHSWPRHEVRFPGRRRTLDSGYSTISSSHLASQLTPVLGTRVRVNAEVRELTPHQVRMADGTTLEASTVIDGRGDPRSPHLDVRFQKFLGRFVAIEPAHGLGGPILMDATVPQTDGFRFIYTLPLSERSLLIEDTYYSDTSTLDPTAVRADLDHYAAAQGWRVTSVTGEEEGVLPIVLAGDISRFWDDGPVGVPRSGMRAALFHPTTGYSLPEAVRLADNLCQQPRFDSDHLYPRIRQRSQDLWNKTAFFRLLNRMLFKAAEPASRYRVLERFYGLGEPLIRRFYAGRLRLLDKVRILSGRPPVPIGRAVACLEDRS